MGCRDGFERVAGARGASGPRVNIPFSRVEKRAILLVCLTRKRTGKPRAAKRDPTMAEVCRDIILRDPEFRKALQRAEKGLTQGA